MTGAADDAADAERIVVVERSIAAPPATVFAFFMTTDAWMQWQGTEGEIDARPGGVFRMNVRGDGFVSGHFLEVSPPIRLVFTWGWEGPDAPYPVLPGASTVEVQLTPDGPNTSLRLTHRIRGATLEPLVRHGWELFTGRLAAVAEGRTP